MTFFNTLTRNSDTSYYYSNYFFFNIGGEREEKETEERKNKSRLGLVTFQKEKRTD